MKALVWNDKHSVSVEEVQGQKLAIRLALYKLLVSGHLLFRVHVDAKPVLLR